MLSRISILSRSSHYRCITTSSAIFQNAEVVKSAEKQKTMKVPEKKPQRDPLVKNFGIAKVDTELLAFPEAFMDMDTMNQAKLRKDSYEDFLKTNVYLNPNDNTNIDKLKAFGSFNCQPMLTTERLYTAFEAESHKLSYANFISNHQIVADMINTYCNDQVKSKYLNKMSSGELHGAVCLTERKPPQEENKAFNTIGLKNDDGWIIDGEKSFVLLNDLKSSLLLVTASIDSVDKCGDFEEKIALFIIDGNSKGVSIIDTHSTIGYEEEPLKRVTIKFSNVDATFENFLSEDLSACLNMLGQLRMNVGVLAVAGVMKPMINKLSDYYINTQTQGTCYKDLDIMKESLGRITARCYALESMVYMTAALKDIYQDQDIDLECGAIKIFAVQTLGEFILSPSLTVGPLTTYKSEGYEKLIRDAIQLIGVEEPIETLKQFVALSALNFAGKVLNEDIIKERNILDHPMFVFTRLRKEISIENPKLKMNLWHDLHESVRPAAGFLEASVYRLRATIEILFARFGTQIFLHSVELTKVAEMATMCYAMYASSSRASRSYCIGLRNAEQELYLVNALCFELHNNVKKLAIEIDHGEFVSTIHYYKLVGEKLMENKKYNLEHPTSRNF